MQIAPPRTRLRLWCTAWVWVLLSMVLSAAGASATFNGKYYRGQGDTEYLRLLEISRRFFEVDPELQNLSMLYEPKWNGLVEGPTWDAWWIQNSYGTTYSILPFLREPFVTFLQHSQDLWFDQIGDAQRVGASAPFDWVAPVGCLCDAARPGWIVYKQGDGRVGMHDWGMEFTAAGVLLQSELLLISRDASAIQHYLPKLELSANFIETRRDPKNDLFLAGPAANLLAPSYAGWKKPNGTYGQAYLAGLSVTYVAALDRLIELEKLAGRGGEARLWKQRRDSAKLALRKLTTEEGYFIRSLDPDGVKHGVYGAPQHGYFEASPNHDAIAFRVADEQGAEAIYRKIASIPELRPFDFILPNYPSYDDMYEKPEGLWTYGTWVNGGHWSTCEARMILGYYRVGQYEDARRSLQRLMRFAEKFRLDNPLTSRGSQVYQPNQPVNLCYDSFGPAAAFMRGLFEYLYTADGLVLVPHIPPGISRLEQLDPVRFGHKQLLLTATGTGPLREVRVNGAKWNHDRGQVFLPYSKTPSRARVEFLFGAGDMQSAEPGKLAHVQSPRGKAVAISKQTSGLDTTELDGQRERFETFLSLLRAEKLGDTYEAAHARLAVECIDVIRLRKQLQQARVIKPLPQESQAAGDELYRSTAARICGGLQTVLDDYVDRPEAAKRRIAQAWLKSAAFTARPAAERVP